MSDSTAVVTEADQLLSASGLPPYSKVIDALTNAKPFVEAVVNQQADPKTFPLSAAHLQGRLDMVTGVLNQHRDVCRQQLGKAAALESDTPQIFAVDNNSTSPSLPGYVLAFPQASHDEADEVMNMLRHGGSVVCRVSPDLAKPALKEAHAELGLERSEGGLSL